MTKYNTEKIKNACSVVERIGFALEKSAGDSICRVQIDLGDRSVWLHLADQTSVSLIRATLEGVLAIQERIIETEVNNHG